MGCGQGTGGDENKGIWIRQPLCCFVRLAHAPLAVPCSWDIPPWSLNIHQIKNRLVQEHRAQTLFFFFFFFNLTYSRWEFVITILPVVIEDLPISPPVHALRFFIATQVQHSYNSSTNGWILPCCKGMRGGSSLLGMIHAALQPKLQDALPIQERREISMPA